MAQKLSDEDIFQLVTDVQPVSEPDRVFFDDDNESEAGPSAEIGTFIEEAQDDLSDVPSEHSDHDTDSEICFSTDESSFSSENEDAEETIVPPTSQATDKQNYFYGKNRYKWAKTAPSAVGRAARHNIIHLPQVRGPARTNPPSTPEDAWHLLFTENILETILEHTNAKITDLCSKYSNIPAWANHTDLIELKALLGLLILSGVFKSGHEDAASLFASDGTGRDIFRATMQIKRFFFLLIALRFDEQETREERKSSGDKLAPISEIYNQLIENCKINYCAGENVTVDEHMIPFRGRCSFRQYLKNKPKKYGLKVLSLCDARTHYLINAFVYCGKDRNIQNPHKFSIPTLTVMKLAEPRIGTSQEIIGFPLSSL